MKKFPAQLFVRRVMEDDGTTFLIAEETVRDAIDGDGPTIVATYELSEYREFAKTVEPTRKK